MVKEMDSVPIRIKRNTRDKLKKLAKSLDDTYDVIINRLIGKKKQ